MLHVVFSVNLPMRKNSDEYSSGEVFGNAKIQPKTQAVP